MNKRIRSLIDEIFSEMKMTPENLALRDEMMANAQAHYADGIARGLGEEEAIQEVAESLGDISGMLREMNEQPKEKRPEKQKPAPFWSAMEQEEADEAEDVPPEQEAQRSGSIDLSDALGRAMSALGKGTQRLTRETRRMARTADRATGGALGDLGRAMGKSLSEVTKAANETLSEVTKAANETFSSLKKPDREEEREEEPKSEADLRRSAATLRAQAEFKQVSGDQEGARDMRRAAYEKELRADALAQEAAMRAAQAQEDYVGADGEIDPERFAEAVDDLAREAQEAGRAQGKDAPDTVSIRRWPVAGLRKIDVQLDADDVEIEAGTGDAIELLWDGGEQALAEPEAILADRVLTLRQANPDLLLSFFSVFSKQGGRLTLRVPQGYGLSYVLRTSSGDIRFAGVDADEIEAGSTSGSIRVSPDVRVRCARLKASTVFGPIEVSATAEDIALRTVSGAMKVEMDAVRLDADAVSGAIVASGACDEWSVNSATGPVELLCSVVPSGKIVVGTVSADARVALPESIRGFVAELSGTGAIVNEFGPDRYGTCQLPVRLESISGKLIITRR